MGCDVREVHGLLNRAAVLDEFLGNGGGEKLSDVGECLWSVLGDGDSEDELLQADSEELVRYDIILTRTERIGLRMRGREVDQRDREIMSGEEWNKVESCIESGLGSDHLKRKDVHDGEDSDEGGSRYRKKRASEDMDGVNDSGIQMMDDGHGLVVISGEETDMLDLDIESDDGHAMVRYESDVEREDPFFFGAEREDTSLFDEEKENHRPIEMDDRYVSYDQTREQDLYTQEGEQWDGTNQGAQFDAHHNQPPKRDPDEDYFGEFPTTRFEDAYLDFQAHPGLHEDHTGAVRHHSTGFDQPQYIPQDESHYTNLDDEYDYERPTEDQDCFGGSFEPLSLSFDSRSYQGVSARSSQVLVPDRCSMRDHLYLQAQTLNAERKSTGPDTERTHDTELATDFNNSDRAETPTSKTSLQTLKKPSLPLLNNDIATHTLGIATFVMLRAKTLKPLPMISAPSGLQNVNPEPQSEPANEPEPQTLRDPPPGLYDHRTLRLPPGPSAPPAKAHRYLASLDLLQKQALVRNLRSPANKVDLVERITLDGADLILDADAALIFVPLLSLPAQKQAEVLLARVARVSWGFGKLLIVFEAYPASRSVRGTAIMLNSSVATSAPAVARQCPIASSTPTVVPLTLDTTPAPVAASAAPRFPGQPNISTISEPELYAYTPPIMKAIRKFRRDLDIAEACGTKSAGCVVRYAFADSVTEAARLSRMFGNMMEEEGEGRGHCGDNQGGAGWGDRKWLDLDPDEVRIVLQAFKKNSANPLL
jgi:hypothetical protein